MFRRCIDSFKPPDSGYAELQEQRNREEKDGGGISRAEDEDGVVVDGGNGVELKRVLKGRHLQMIAIGGSIGTGLFVASGGSLVIGGPASVLIAFLLVGTMLFTVVHALGELAVLFPQQGSFAVYGTRFLDPAWGFAMGWNYALQWLIVLPLELSAAAIVVDYWQLDSFSTWMWISLFLIGIVIINLFGVEGYGEAEFVFSIIKVIAVLGFIICAICIDVGGSPSKHYFGTDTWRKPGAFNNGFPGLCACFVNAAFSFSGTELVGLAAAEAADPVKTIPKATKQVFWRILFFYVASLLLIGFIVPFDNPNLLNESANAASPFVIAIELGGIKVLPSIFNGVILIAVLSVGNSSTYGSSRTLSALAKIGQAPKIFSYIDRRGRPLVSLAVALLFGGLAYIGLGASGQTVFDWLLAISGLSSFFTWGSICLCHIRFRAGWKAQGHKLDEIPFRSAVGVIGSYYGLLFNSLCIVAQFYVAVWPPGAEASVEDFFKAFLAAPVTIVFYAVYKGLYWSTSNVVTNVTMDVDTGRKAVNPILEVIDRNHGYRPWYKKILDELV